MDRIVSLVVVRMVWVGQLVAVDLLVVCNAETGTRVTPGAQAEPLKISDPPILKTTLATPGSLQQEVMFPPAEQHQ